MYFLYNLFLPLLLVLLTPALIFKLMGDKSWRNGFMQRLYIDDSIFAALAGERPIWFHAASVGEVNASLRLLDEMKKRWPRRKLVISTFTPTGKEAAMERTSADAVFFLPLDLSFIVKKAIRKINPHMLILMETEIWPNLIKQCGVGGIPVVMVNGRVSDKSFGKYQWLRPLLQRVFGYVSLVLAQSEESRKRFVSLGIEADNVMTVGNLKFDMQVKRKAVRTIEKWGGPVLIAGSTREEEEKTILSAYLQVRQKYPRLKLILAPRHLPRTAEVESIINGMNLGYEKFSELKNSISAQVLLVDTLGELSSLYFYGDVVFVGGSLVPLGGQNMLEPALCGKPVLFGPHVENFREAARVLTKGGGALMVHDSNSLAQAIEKLLSDPQLRSSMGSRAKASADAHRGATEKTMNALARFLR